MKRYFLFYFESDSTASRPRVFVPTQHRHMHQSSPASNPNIQITPEKLVQFCLQLTFLLLRSWSALSNIHLYRDQRKEYICRRSHFGPVSLCPTLFKKNPALPGRRPSFDSNLTWTRTRQKIPCPYNLNVI